MLSRTFHNVMSHARCRSCLIANCNKTSNVTSFTSSHPCNQKVSGQCSTWMILNCQLLRPEHEFVEHVTAFQSTVGGHRRFAFNFAFSSSSQIRSHSVFQRPSESSLRPHAVTTSSLPVWFVWIPLDVFMQVTRGVDIHKKCHTLFEVKLLQ